MPGTSGFVHVTSVPSGDGSYVETQFWASSVGHGGIVGADGEYTAITSLSFTPDASPPALPGLYQISSEKRAAAPPSRGATAVTLRFPVGDAHEPAAAPVAGPGTCFCSMKIKAPT